MKKHNKNQLDALLRILETSRQTGQTTLLKKLASENDIVIVALNSRSAQEIGKGAISLTQLENKHIYNNPVFMDNAALYSVLKGALQYIDELEKLAEE